MSIKKHPTCRSGFYVDPDFFLYQHESGRRILELAQSIFESGQIYPKSGNPNVLVYEISSTGVLREKVIPFFERYVVPFSCKRETFERFREVLEAMERGEHRVPMGLAEIVKKVYAMNPNSKGKARSRPLDRGACENPQRPYVGHPRLGMKIWSSPHGDMGDNCLR